MTTGWRRLRAVIIPSPEETIGGYMTADESVILVDEPSTSAFLLDALDDLFIIMGVALVSGFLAGRGGGVVVALLGFMVIVVLATFLIAKRLRAWYTRYVLTDMRIIRTWGVFRRQTAWIPWTKVTDILVTQTLPGRIFGFATIRIESANEASGFKEISDLRDPFAFVQTITSMVHGKQGKPDLAGIATAPAGPIRRRP